jgi:hypothetical protein
LFSGSAGSKPRKVRDLRDPNGWRWFWEIAARKLFKSQRLLR